MGGEFIGAGRAYQMGLYNTVVPPEKLEAETDKWAKRLADGPGYGLAITKRMLNEEASMTLAEAMQAEGWIQGECMKHPDYREAYDAAMEKRAPDFRRSAAAARS